MTLPVSSSVLQGRGKKSPAHICSDCFPANVNIINFVEIRKNTGNRFTFPNETPGGCHETSVPARPRYRLARPQFHRPRRTVRSPPGRRLSSLRTALQILSRTSPGFFLSKTPSPEVPQTPAQASFSVSPPATPTPQGFPSQLEIPTWPLPPEGIPWPASTAPLPRPVFLSFAQVRVQVLLLRLKTVHTDRRTIKRVSNGRMRPFTGNSPV